MTVVIIRDDLVAKSPDDLPSLLNYKVFAEGKSLLNTPPTFAIYMVKLVTDWLINDIGGLAKMAEINKQKAACSTTPSPSPAVSTRRMPKRIAVR